MLSLTTGDHATIATALDSYQVIRETTYDSGEPYRGDDPLIDEVRRRLKIAIASREDGRVLFSREHSEVILSVLDVVTKQSKDELLQIFCCTALAEFNAGQRDDNFAQAA